jgi:hypothetical protein
MPREATEAGTMQNEVKQEKVQIARRGPARSELRMEIFPCVYDSPFEMVLLIVFQCRVWTTSARHFQ